MSRYPAPASGRSRRSDYDPESRYRWEANRIKKRRAFMDAMKIKAGCAECGYRDNPVALDFAHIDPATKEFNLGSSLMHSIDRVMAEIKKCRVLCANCHRVETASDDRIKRGRPGSQ